MTATHRLLAATAIVLLAVAGCGDDSSGKSDEPLPNAGVIPPTAPATGVMFQDQHKRYTLNAPEGWIATMVGTPPQLNMSNPDDRSVQIVGDFGVGLDLDGAKAKAAEGIKRPSLTLSVVGEGRWWRRNGVEGWAVELEGTSSGKPIEAHWIWLVGPTGTIALVGAGPPEKNSSVRNLVESVANSVVFAGTTGAAASTSAAGGGARPNNLVGEWLYFHVSSSGKTTRTKTLVLCADGRFFDSTFNKMTTSPTVGSGTTSGTVGSDDSAGTWSASGAGKSGTLTLAYSRGEPITHPYETRGKELTVNELVFERDKDHGKCR